MNYCEVSVAGKHVGRQYYTYSTSLDVAEGNIVVVPYGKTTAFGIVRNMVKKPTFKTKEIVQVLPFVLPLKSLELLKWFEHFYPYDFGEMSNLFIPPNPLVKPRKLSEEFAQKPIKILPIKTKDQASAIKIIEQNQHVLLHGKTGTGKTRVFLEQANNSLNDGKSVLLLTPEIGLTPQLVSSVRDHCPAPVFVNHSQMTPAQRRLSWEAALDSKQASVFIGPRSSLFLPFKKLGLIVVDEAHDQSYKNMQSPRYNGLYVAAMLAKIHDAKLVQSTATPSINDYFLSINLNIPLANMSQIAAGHEASDGLVVDMTDNKQFTKNKYLSDPLIEAMANAKSRQEQSLIFINRRGSARIVQCNKCGHTEECPNCGLPATYHHDSYELRCHICGFRQKAKPNCTNCSSTDLLFFAPGTKGLEQDLSKLFPGAKIARFDLDTKSKDSLHRQLDRIKEGEADIIIGTQLITKGLDLPRLSVVGVINADSSLAMPDYRAEEVAFQQLYQVTGRVGRGHIRSKYFIQTRQPNHPVIEAATKRDWQEFYNYELHKRQIFKYPPYANIAVFKLSKAKISTIQTASKKLINQLDTISGLSILGPSPSYHDFSAGKHHWQIVIKSKSRANLVKAALLAGGDWQVDIDPISLM